MCLIFKQILQISKDKDINRKMFVIFRQKNTCFDEVTYLCTTC